MHRDVIANQDQYVRSDIANQRIVHEYVKELNSQFDKTVEFVSRNLIKYRLILYMPDDSVFSRKSFALTSPYLKEAIAEYIIANEVLGDCDYFTVPDQVIVPFSRHMMDDIENLKLRYRETFIQELANLLYRKRAELHEIFSTNINDCYLNNLKLVLEKMGQ